MRIGGSGDTSVFLYAVADRGVALATRDTLRQTD